MHQQGAALVLTLAAVLGCSDQGGSGGGGQGGAGGASGNCMSGVSCQRLEDCPGVSCTCPGVRFPVTIHQCSGQCCATTCETACPTASGAGGSGGVGGGGTGGVVACPPGASDIEVDWMTPNPQGTGIAGTISLPANVLAGRATELSVEKAGPDAGGTQLIHSYVTTAGKLTLSYHLSKVQDGNYFLHFSVDQSGNGTLGDPGDFAGFYNGTVATPITSKANAPLVTLVGSCEASRDFGVGPVP